MNAPQNPSARLSPTSRWWLLPAGRVGVKVCGVTRPEDAVFLAHAGVDAMGVIFAPSSKRRVDVQQAAEVVAAARAVVRSGDARSSVGVSPRAQVATVAVFVDPTAAELEDAVARVGVDALQVHGAWPDGSKAKYQGVVARIAAHAFAPALQPSAWNRADDDVWLLDGARAGSGETFTWSHAAHWRGVPGWWLAGGLHAGNVAAAVAALAPAWVDVATGVEASAGVKDPVKVRAFMDAVRGS